jgi:hypothetical protein
MRSWRGIHSFAPIPLPVVITLICKNCSGNRRSAVSQKDNREIRLIDLTFRDSWTPSFDLFLAEKREFFAAATWI